MNKVDKALKALSSELSKNPRVVEFKKTKKLIAEDAYLKETETKLKELQQKMTQNMGDKVVHKKYQEEYLVLKKAYENHPYILNYNSLHAEVEELLYTLKKVIE